MQFLKELLVSVASGDFGTYAAVAALVCVVGILAGNAYNKKWGDLGDVVMAMLAAAGFISGLKIVVLTFAIDPKQLGALSDDRAALLIGGAATTVLALKEGLEKAKKAAGF